MGKAMTLGAPGTAYGSYARTPRAKDSTNAVCRFSLSTSSIVDFRRRANNAINSKIFRLFLRCVQLSRKCQELEVKNKKKIRNKNKN